MSIGNCLKWGKNTSNEMFQRLHPIINLLCVCINTGTLPCPRLRSLLWTETLGNCQLLQQDHFSLPLLAQRPTQQGDKCLPRDTGAKWEKKCHEQLWRWPVLWSLCSAFRDRNKRLLWGSESRAIRRFGSSLRKSAGSPEQCSNLIKNSSEAFKPRNVLEL